MLSARLGDLLSDLYLASMVLKHYENDGCPSEDLPLVQWSLDYLIHHYQEAFKEIIDNYPNRPLAYLLRATVFPLGMHFKAPSDKLEKSLAQSVTENNSTRDRLVSGLYVEQGDNNPLGHVNEVFIESLGLEPLNKKIRQAIKDKKLPKMQGIELIEKARDEKIISKEEADQLVAFNDQLMSVIHVDDFDQEELIRTPCS
jgi:acyl-CoA dehydrogenase